jgi:class 3 adenylate cyclase/YHS domain-containing protein
MSEGSTIEATFCFIDIAGYTALTDTHGEHAAADIVDEFVGLVRAAVEPLGSLQSLTGDCAFVVFDDPRAALDALCSLYRAIGERRHFPIVRAGLHHGPALVRGERHFGSTVNIAARVAAQATGGQILCTREIADALAAYERSDLAIEHRGAAALRNLTQPIDIYEILLPEPTHEVVIDPVCRMQVDPRRAAGDLHYNHRTYWFCSLECVERFARQPSAYTDS